MLVAGQLDGGQGPQGDSARGSVDRLHLLLVVPKPLPQVDALNEPADAEHEDGYHFTHIERVRSNTGDRHCQNQPLNVIRSASAISEPHVAWIQANLRFVCAALLFLGPHSPAGP